MGDKGRGPLQFSELKLVGFLKTKMQWHQARQRVLAENVANADTPGYRAGDLKPLGFASHLGGRLGGTDVAAMRTHAAHVTAALPGADAGFATAKDGGWEITPEGNAVVLEEQMIKVAENQFDYRLASTLYSRSLGLLKTALGRNA